MRRLTSVIERSNEKADLDKILALTEDYGVERIVVGLPRSLNGSIGRQAEEVLAFTRVLSEHVGITVDTWDERFTSVAADSLLSEAGVKQQRRKGRRDAMAAAITLQGYLEDRAAAKRTARRHGSGDHSPGLPGRQNKQQGVGL